ncbi:MAG: hypothetical protein D6729_00555 [Deltaproteobacteria bacterium]|nr:MAG: hypothetical protein D6729_00555 [Deltaproteobacteria bacterium]
MLRMRHPLGFAACALLGWAAWLGCPAVSVCHFDTDCPETQVCEAGRCIEADLTAAKAGACRVDGDCAWNERCAGGRCLPTGGGPDGGSDGGEADGGVAECMPELSHACDGHTGPCPCVAGLYALNPDPNCAGTEEGAVLVEQDGCSAQVTLYDDNGNWDNSDTATVAADGTLDLKQLQCTGRPSQNTGNFILDCFGCQHRLIRFRDPDPTVAIEPGPFLMGSENGEPDASPTHEVYLSCYRIDLHEVTNGAYYECVRPPTTYRGTPCTLPAGVSTPEDLLHPTVIDLPVRGVGWFDADKYCRFRGGLLPTEAQWEKAARGPAPSQATYPWGEDPPDCTRALTSECGASQPKAPGETPGDRSPYGVWDLAGNVREWVNDYYHPRYYEESPAQDPRGPSTFSRERVVRGGSFQTPIEAARTFHRQSDDIYDLTNPERWMDLGFRCAYQPAD